MSGRGSLPRSILFLAYAAFLLLVGTVAGFLMAPWLGRSRAFWKVARAYSRHLTRLAGVTHEMRGWEDLPEGLREGREPAIFLANHTTNLDPVILACHLPCRPAFVAKMELAFVPVLGAVIWLSGAIFINRSNRDRAIRSLQRAALRIRAGLNIMAFPEGTRSRTGELVVPFKKGMFNMAMQAGVPVVPMVLLGAHELLPPGCLQCRHGHVRIQVGRPLHPGDHADPDALRVAAEEQMAALLKAEPNPAPGGR